MAWLILIAVLPYFVILLDIFRNLRKIQPFNREVNTLIKVSVIIVCRNEEKNLPNLLNDLYSQDYEPDLFEVIVIDDNSSDNTYAAASSYSLIKNYKVLKNPISGKKGAIKAGVEAATGKLLITTDADCTMGKRWISEISSFYCTGLADMIIAPVQLENKPGFAGRFMELEFLSLQGITAGTAIAGSPVMCNGANLAFTKEAYLRHSGNLHNELQSGDDIFFLHSLKKEKKSKIEWLNSADGIVTTKQSASLGSYINQRARWISKAKAYDDRFTKLVSIVTFVTILINVSLLFSGIFNHEYLLIFLASFILKSIPDIIILRNTAGRYNRMHLIKWFTPSQAVYPYYVIVVACYALFRGSRWK
jgi:biofilm PGA synthesis N-glycosyltransferase PgaC